MLNTTVSRTTCALLALVSARMSAAWTVTLLHPAGEPSSEAMGAGNGLQVGRTRILGNSHAATWSGTSSSWVDIHPTGASFSFAGSSHGTLIGGQVDGSATLWTTPTTTINLNPAGAQTSTCLDVHTSQQVGSAQFGGLLQAALWTGTSASYSDLTPTGATQAALYGTDGLSQVGYAIYGAGHAGLWTGTAGSFVDLHPTGANSSRAVAVDGAYQVGRVATEGVTRATLWSGSAGSAVDLNPTGASYSEARSIAGTSVVGYAKFGGVDRAIVWDNLGASWQDLGSLLPSQFSWSYASGVYNDGTTLSVAGVAMNANTGTAEAILWTRAVPEPGTLVAFGAAMALVVRRRFKPRRAKPGP